MSDVRRIGPEEHEAASEAKRALYEGEIDLPEYWERLIQAGVAVRYVPARDFAGPSPS